jgi:hypothetical protein
MDLKTLLFLDFMGIGLSISIFWARKRNAMDSVSGIVSFLHFRPFCSRQVLPSCRLAASDIAKDGMTGRQV